MAANATVFKVELQVSDMDRNYYASHDLVLAQHPSETDTRLMVRLLAFALHADERLAFGRGLGEEDEPALWRHDYTGDVELWIELGHPDESRLRRACARARQVVVVGYAGNASSIWWEKTANALSRLRNLTVMELDPAGIDAALAMLGRTMRLTAMIQDGELQLMDTEHNVAIRPSLRMAPVEATA